MFKVNEITRIWALATVPYLLEESILFIKCTTACLTKRAVIIKFDYFKWSLFIFRKWNYKSSDAYWYLLLACCTLVFLSGSQKGDSRSFSNQVKSFLGLMRCLSNCQILLFWGFQFQVRKRWCMLPILPALVKWLTMVSGHKRHWIH